MATGHELIQKSEIIALVISALLEEKQEIDKRANRLLSSGKGGRIVENTQVLPMLIPVNTGEEQLVVLISNEPKNPGFKTSREGH